MFQRTQPMLSMLGLLVVVLCGVAFSVEAYTQQYDDWQGYLFGALGGALCVILSFGIAGRALLRSRHRRVSRMHVTRFSPAARTFHLLNLLTAYATIAVEMQRWDADPKWRRTLLPQYQHFRQTLISVERWRAQASGERPRDLVALTDAALAASHYTLDGACLLALGMLATMPLPVHAAQTPRDIAPVR